MDWQPMESAPKGRTHILAFYSPKQRVFEVWHEGCTEDGYDLGWALYPGYGGVPDYDLAGWMPLPAPPTR